MLELFKEQQREITDLQYICNLLTWDLRINTSQKAKSELINLISKLKEKILNLETSQEYEDSLSKVIESKEFTNLAENEKRYISKIQQQINQFKSVPTNFYNEYSKLKMETNLIWKNAKENNNFDLYKPSLIKLIEMTKKYYSYINKNENKLYNTMLNEYDKGLKIELIDPLFMNLKEQILPLVPREIQPIPKIKINYSTEELLNCAKYLLKYIGFDMNRGSIYIYEQGYTEKMNGNDIRIAFRKTDDPIDFVTTVLHEGGHGIFEQNISPNLSQYENKTTDNIYALHESQSRFFENFLGRNKNFWIPIYDEVKKMLRLNLSLDEFVKLLNTPKCNPIRVKSDELTYCLHIILRYEIERDLFENKITVDEIPNEWNKKMYSYLGIKIANDSEGILQDIQWSEGYFGYFPTYLIGSIYDGMLYETIEKDLGNIDNILSSGEVQKITNYLISNIYINGGAFSLLEINEKMTHQNLSIDPLIKYFKKKYKKR